MCGAPEYKIIDIGSTKHATRSLEIGRCHNDVLLHSLAKMGSCVVEMIYSIKVIIWEVI